MTYPLTTKGIYTLHKMNLCILTDTFNFSISSGFIIIVCGHKPRLFVNRASKKEEKGRKSFFLAEEKVSGQADKL